jgi:hypothetical protein
VLTLSEDLNTSNKQYSSCFIRDIAGRWASARVCFVGTNTQRHFQCDWFPDHTSVSASYTPAPDWRDALGRAQKFTRNLCLAAKLCGSCPYDLFFCRHRNENSTGHCLSPSCAYHTHGHNKPLTKDRDHQLHRCVPRITLNFNQITTSTPNAAYRSLKSHALDLKILLQIPAKWIKNCRDQ